MITKPKAEKDSFIVYGDINGGNGIEILPTYSGQTADTPYGNFTMRQIYDALRDRNIPFICTAFFSGGHVKYDVQVLTETAESDDDDSVLYTALFGSATTISTYTSSSLDEVMEYQSGA